MPNKRARITDDNDPLSSTDEVLAGFQQLSQSISIPVDQSKRQEVEKSESQPVDKLTKKQADKSESQEVQLNSGQKEEKQQVNQSTSQQVDKSKLRKVTFQIQESVVNRLDKLHLQLQLELGKANAPYKEVIVEEAISRLLEEMESNRDGVLEVLQERQSERK